MFILDFCTFFSSHSESTEGKDVLFFSAKHFIHIRQVLNWVLNSFKVYFECRLLFIARRNYFPIQSINRLNIWRKIYNQVLHEYWFHRSKFTGIPQLITISNTFRGSDYLITNIWEFSKLFLKISKISLFKTTEAICGAKYITNSKQ